MVLHEIVVKTSYETIHNPMFYTLGQAAKATGISKPTLSRAVKSGKISAQKQGDGSFIIDPAELHRVYPPITVTGNNNGNMKQSETPSNTNALQVKIDLICEERERERKQHEETILDLRRRLDQSETERRETQGKLTALLTHQPEKQPEPKKEESPLYKKLFGKPWK